MGNISSLSLKTDDDGSILNTSTSSMEEFPGLFLMITPCKVFPFVKCP